MTGKREQAIVRAVVAEALIIERTGRQQGGPAGGWARHVGIGDPAVAAVFDVEIAGLLERCPELTAGLDDLTALPTARGRLVERVRIALDVDCPHAGRTLEALLIPQRDAAEWLAGPPGTANARGRRRVRRLVGRVGRLVNGRVIRPLLLLNAIILMVLAAGPLMHWRYGTPLPDREWYVLALSACAVWALSFMPGWLFVRFLDRRAGALWDEYVVHIHRLQLDSPGNLPEPPRSSWFHSAWLADGGLGRVWMRNLYQEKFDAYYGRSVSRFGTDLNRSVKAEALFPIFLCTALLAVGWATVLYSPAAAVEQLSDPTLWTALAVAFMGSYLFFLQTLLRRYFQADLRAGAFVSGYIRTVGALVVVAVLYAVLPSQTPANLVIGIAFVVGWFPDAGLQWLNRIVARRLRSVVPTLEPAFPLNRLDGLNVWYENRLLEEGIEDLQNLLTAKTVDVLLHTRVPVARYVDWVDQALLLLHLPAEPSTVDQPGYRHKTRTESAKKDTDAHPRHSLRNCGIRSATALIAALDTDQRKPEDIEALLRQLEEKKLPRAAVLALHAIVRGDPQLNLVNNWRSADIPARNLRQRNGLPRNGAGSTSAKVKMIDQATAAAK
jgi:hypothetical protein